MAQDENFGVLGCATAGEQAEPADHRPQDQVEESQGHEHAIMPDRLHQRTSRSQAADEVVGTHRAKVGLGERGKPWWEQSASARRMRWQTAMAEIDALDAGGSA